VHYQKQAGRELGSSLSLKQLALYPAFGSTRFGSLDRRKKKAAGHRGRLREDGFLPCRKVLLHFRHFRHPWRSRRNDKKKEPRLKPLL
jgi:hypothetical protein